MFARALPPRTRNLVRLDPDRFLRFYQKARQVEIAIEKADKDEGEAQLTIITKRYPCSAHTYGAFRKTSRLGLLQCSKNGT
jgi:hypothetical protein